MKKKNKLTYAQQAKRIVSKYKRRLGENFERPDAMAEAAMQKELDALMEKQEMLKQSQTESQFQEMAMGGVLPQYIDGSYLPGGNMWETITNPRPRTILKPGTTLLPETTVTPMGITTKATDPVTQQPNNSWWNDIPTESKIGMGAQLAGVLGQGILAATAGKPKPMKYNPVTITPPEQMRSDEQLNQATRSYRGAQKNLSYLSPSQYMAAMNDLATREAGTKAGIVENVENQNVDIRNRDRMLQARLAQENEQMRLGVDQYNEAARQGYVGNIGQTIGNITNVVAGGLRDETMRKTQNDMMRFMSQANYGSKTIKGRVIPTNKVGNLEYYVDPDGTPHWEEAGSPIDKKTFLKKVDEYLKRLNP